ncbi:DUF6036 family nucleotidyltransferase [Leifsonia soli]
MVSLRRDDVIAGLRQLVRELHDRGAHATIRIVGGAAIMLRYFEDRRITPDVDASISTDTDLDEIVRSISAEHGWPTDWLNTAAAGFIPFAGDDHWEAIHDDDTVSVWVATPPCLLAMKLKAARRGRDDDDVAVLLAYLDIDSADEAEAVFESQYPGELPPPRAYDMLEDILRVGVPDVRRPPAVDLR